MFLQQGTETLVSPKPSQILHYTLDKADSIPISTQMTLHSHPKLLGLYHQTEVEVPIQSMQLGLHVNHCNSSAHYRELRFSA